MRAIRISLAVAAVTALAAPVAARADAVTDWNTIASDAIVAKAGQSPPVSALSFAMVQGAVYDAVNSIEQLPYQPYLGAVPANPWDSKEAAVATAAYIVLHELFSGQATTLQGLYDDYVAGLPDQPAGAKDAGIAVGEAAARAMLAARAHDGRGGQVPQLLPEGPGVWRPVAPFFTPDPTSWLANVLPFLVPNAAMLRTDGPNPLTSAAYAADFNEVKELGSRTSTERTADQTEAAIWWQGTGAFWNGVTRSIVATHDELDLEQNARLFAMLNMAAADGFIGCYNDKYYWQFWRPIAAIRAADTDGNPATEADPTWTPLFDPATPQFGPPLSTPPFPDHPSAHSCASSAVVHTLQEGFGTDKIPFSAFSARTHTTRSFERLSDALKEVIDARVWGGIHFRTADVQGAVLGKKVAHYLRQHYFRPTR
jgi:PAP2 superfamily